MDKFGEDRRTLLKAGGASSLGFAGLAGCLGTGGKLATETTTVGMVYSVGGLGDNSFNDMAHEGVERAEVELDIEYQHTEPDSPDDIGSLQRRFARSSEPEYDLVCCIGFTQTNALTENADRFADQQFMLVDAVVEEDNVANYVFKSHEGSFQAGHLAGLLTDMEFSAGGGETNDDLTVGFVGGQEIPLIKEFEAGYRAGSRHANADVNVLSAYAGSFNDPAQGQEIALSMYNEGADIVYHAAGGTGNGVFQAAQEAGRYAIGVDADQSESLPEYSDVILASMINGIDEAVYRSIENVQNDEFEGGAVNELGLQEGGVEVVYGGQLGPDIPDEVKSRLEESRQRIVDGELAVPTDPENV